MADVELEFSKLHKNYRGFMGKLATWYPYYVRMHNIIISTS